MATAQDLTNTTARILTAVQTATTNITKLITDTNATLAAMKSQSGPVMQDQLDEIVRQNNATIANLDALNSAIIAEDAAVATAPTPTPMAVDVATVPAPEPMPAPTPPSVEAAASPVPAPTSEPVEAAPAPTEAAPVAEDVATPEAEVAVTTTAV